VLFPGNEFECHFSRKEFEGICSPLLSKPVDYVKKFLRDQELDSSDIKSLVLVGGSSRIPFIEKQLYGLFPKSIVAYGVDQDLIVAQGAAMQAASMVRTFIHCHSLLF
jgi:molecular chaperone DnaK (HSP70)